MKKTLKELKIMLKEQRKILEEADYMLGHWETVEENAQHSIEILKKEIKRRNAVR